MADSPETNTDGPIEITVKSGGAAIADTIDVLSVRTRAEMNRIPEAVLILADGDVPAQEFPVADADTFKPGAEIEIAIGYGSNEQATIFEGVVTAMRLRVGQSGNPELVVTCRDKGYKLTLGRRSRVFEDTKDSDAISTLASEAGLTSSITTTSVTHAKLVQYRASDWDWIVARAEMNGMLAALTGGKLRVEKPDLSVSAILTVTLGVDLIEFDAEMDSRAQFSAVSTSAWSIAEQAAASSSGSKTAAGKWGNLTASVLAEVAARGNFDLGSAAPITPSELENISSARQARNELARLRGTVRFRGNGTAALGKTLELAGLGDRFSGTGLICSVSHRVEGGEWETTTGLGLDPAWRSDRPGGAMAAPGAGGFTAPVRGLQIGTVSKLTGDPTSENAIEVKVPLIGDGTATLWARLAGFYATSGAGAYFLPEVGDEVVLGFFEQDPGYPVILGALYSSRHASPFEATEDNFTKALVTPEGLKLEFDDEKKVVTLVTPCGNSAVLDDDGESITLNDQNGNSVKLESIGITLDSASDISIKASGSVTIEAGNDVKISGLNVIAEADAQVTVKGSASAEVSASGQVTVKGAMVMIN